MSRCNYCTLRDLKKWAAKQGLRITTHRSTIMGGGREVFMHPPGDVDLQPTSDNPHWVAWFALLPEKCEC